jgi:hypothetical protein
LPLGGTMALRLASFTMMRNERAILNPFLDQLETFFDASFILDHNSLDDSRELVRARRLGHFHLFDIKAAGYPQSEVTTFFSHKIFSEIDPDFIFFLDCDEFFSFKDREELERWLHKNRKNDVLQLPWLNICPVDLGGGNIFAGSFLRGPDQIDNQKIILAKNICNADPQFVIAQGSHELSSKGGTIATWSADDKHIIHIPVQSRTQLAIKVASGYQTLKNDPKNLAKGLGYHWLAMANEFLACNQSDQAIHYLALNYAKRSRIEPDQATDWPTVDFKFPYVKSDYQETSAGLAAQICSFGRNSEKAYSTQFTVTDSNGSIILESYDKSREMPAAPERIALVADDTFAVQYENLIAPLFLLPSKLAVSTWMGHVPFMFVLFKLLQPQTYVELGVYTGCSFIAACTAAETFKLGTCLFGIDTWQGDPHAGNYSDRGEEMFRGLKDYIDATFSNAKLIRATFSEAKLDFNPGSVDLLHIDGYHTFEAVKDDFVTWFPKLAPDGVVLFHDICVYERNFGVHRLWAELKEKFATVEFHHSFGFGVLFVDGNDPRIASLRKIVQNPKAWQLYQNLVADIAGALPERAGYYSNITNVQALETKVQALETNAQAPEWPSSQPSPTELLDMLYRSRILRTFGPLSKSWRFTKKVLQDRGIVK